MLDWADAIYIFDTGSIDGTWEIVQEVASQDPRVKPLRRDNVYFSETWLRGWLFNQARTFMSDGDWFLRVDADEFHHVAPPDFVRTRLSAHETIVYHQYYNFVLLDSEVRRWESGEETMADRGRPIETRRQWYEVSVYSEPRLCRYRSSMKWPPAVSFPFNAGYVAQARLPIRHYPHRDPAQLERRCRLRAVMMSDAVNRANWSRPELHHWSESEWRKFITPDGRTGLAKWNREALLPDPSYTNHLAGPMKRILQRLVHPFLLPLLDRVRPSWPENAYPQRIPEDVVEALKRELGRHGTHGG